MQFNLQAHLDHAYTGQKPKFSLDATTREEFDLWQSEFRLALTDLLGLSNRIPENVPQTDYLSSEDRSSYIEEKHNLLIDDVSVPMYLLIPKSEPPYKTIIAFHGHGMGVQQILGNYPDDRIRQKMIATDENFAQRLAEDGFLVCAIEQQGFGERITEQVSDNGNSCRHLAFQYMMLGKSLLGERVREGITAINYLQSRDDIYLQSIGCTGHSGGAITALFLSALDKRVAISVISSYFCQYQQSILGMPHCECNYVPDLLTLCDIGDIVALIAPRQLGLIHGKRDSIFPIAGFHQALPPVTSSYTLSNALEKLSASIHPQGHQYDYQTALSLFQSGR